MSEVKDIWDALAIPFTPEQIKQRPGRGGMTFDYVDARDVMNRLDFVLGPERWLFEVQAIPPNGVSKGRLSIKLDDGTWIHREDFGYPNSDDDDEPFKSSASDALKRCAVHFGVGRHLYEKDRGHAARPSGTAPASRPPQRPSQAPTAAQTDRDGTPLHICPVHRVEWQHKVGVAKGTGKPYDFWGCPGKNPDGKFCRERPTEAFVASEEAAELDDLPF